MRVPSKPLRVLAVDPGLTRCGMAVVDVAPNRQATLVDVRVVGTPNTASIGERLATIDEAIADFFESHRPDHLAVERMFAQNNTPTVVGTAQASGVVIAAAGRRNIPVALLTPSEVKAAVTGNGSADKNQVTAMVTRVLGLDSPPKPADAADAMALAIAHAWRGGLHGRGLDTGKLTSPARPSKFPGVTAKNSRPTTPAQRAWLEAERRAR
ncbi:crossover junction endodeoxyribonuclease RuvC [Auritidibacter ignavus]|nr:crossover junction endodeoxyribonuclease RuvC [Auritidibacter ignavus]WGH86861.1 crossover junction endodeoxyribonuclease RuvC [Auritidibacter ignavus]WGH89145.1 crossover junction endodeoxyribonuclease RuvC [Auritidibacter ignavus]